MENGTYRTLSGSEVTISGEHSGRIRIDFDWIEEGACCDCHPYVDEGMLCWECEQCDSMGAEVLLRVDKSQIMIPSCSPGLRIDCNGEQWCDKKSYWLEKCYREAQDESSKFTFMTTVYVDAMRIKCCRKHKIEYEELAGKSMDELISLYKSNPNQTELF